VTGTCADWKTMPRGDAGQTIRHTNLKHETHNDIEEQSLVITLDYIAS